MADFEVIVIGGGLASAQALVAYREAGGGGRALLVSRDDTVPYHRPPLTKRFLRGEQEAADTLVKPEAWYRENDVELLLETTVDAVRPDDGRVVLDGGREPTYERLLVATGARPRMLDVPGAGLEGVFTLRTLSDATAIREAARRGGRAVAVGGSFIGMETAASLRLLGVEVTVVEMADALFPVLASDEISAQLAELYRGRGVDVVLGDSVAEFRGGGRLEEVVTAGGRTLSADLAVVGIGVVPNVELLEGSGIEVDNGVLVDAAYRASVAGVWAAGDVASFEDPVAGRRRRIEHWSNANLQGTEVGRALAGQDVRYDAVATFFTQLFDTVIKVFGDPPRGTAPELEGSLEDGRLLGLYLADGRVAGAVVSGQDEETEERLKRLIRERAPRDSL